MRISIFVLSLHTLPLGLLCFISLSLFTFPQMDAGDTAHRILSLSEGSPADAKQQLLKNTMELIQSEPKVAPTPSLSVAGDYLRIFRHLLRSAFFPHCGCPIPPRKNGIRSRILAREWIFSQVQGDMASDSWIRRAYLPRISPCARDVISEWARRDYPPFPPPRLIAQFSSAFTTISPLCMSLHD